MSAYGTTRTGWGGPTTSAVEGRTDMPFKLADVRVLGRSVWSRLFAHSHSPSRHKVLGSRQSMRCFFVGLNETARVHHVYWRCGYSSVRGTRAAEVDAGGRRPWYRPTRRERTEYKRVSSGIGRA